MCVDCQVNPLIDCSEAAQAQRDADIANLRALRLSVITNVSDRGRSVSYDRREIAPMLNDLLAEKFYCLYGYLPPSPNRRFLAPPAVIKGL